MSSGQADYGFLDSQVAGYVVSTSKGVFKLVGHAVNVAPYGIATQKNANGLALAKAIQAALKVMIANGIVRRDPDQVGRLGRRIHRVQDRPERGDLLATCSRQLR